ncbi:MAG: ammonium transporter [Cytophagales bacterium]|nr:ammonium transporter [Cytophagales bacterium]
MPRWEQLAVQGLGILVCFVFTFGISYTMFQILKATVGLRVSPMDEKAGIIIHGLPLVEDLSENGHGSKQMEEEEIDPAELLKLMQQMEGGQKDS